MCFLRTQIILVFMFGLSSAWADGAIHNAFRTNEQKKMVGKNLDGSPCSARIFSGVLYYDFEGDISAADSERELMKISPNRVNGASFEDMNARIFSSKSSNQLVYALGGMFDMSCKIFGHCTASVLTITYGSDLNIVSLSQQHEGVLSESCQFNK